MEYLDSYRKLIIEPLEEYKRNIIEKYEKSLFFKKYYENILDKIEEELMNKYQKYYYMSVDEIEFNKYINKQIEI